MGTPQLNPNRKDRVTCQLLVRQNNQQLQPRLQHQLLHRKSHDLDGLLANGLRANGLPVNGRPQKKLLLAQSRQKKHDGNGTGCCSKRSRETFSRCA